jgi:hydrogenase maturation protease
LTAPRLVFGWGNASRGDDALGPLFVARLREQLGEAAQGRIDFLEDYQLQVEHALDLVGRRQVLFVDASLESAAPFVLQPVHAARDASFSSHAVSPEAVMQVYRDLHHEPPPPCLLLAIRGERFGLGEPMSLAAEAHLEAALAWAIAWAATDGWQ